MGDYTITWLTNAEKRDVTFELTGRDNRLEEDARVEMTNWTKFINFWDAVSKAPLFSERKIEDGTDNG